MECNVPYFATEEDEAFHSLHKTCPIGKQLAALEFTESQSNMYKAVLRKEAMNNVGEQLALVQQLTTEAPARVAQISTVLTQVENDEEKASEMLKNARNEIFEAEKLAELKTREALIDAQNSLPEDEKTQVLVAQKAQLEAQFSTLAQLLDAKETELSASSGFVEAQTALIAYEKDLRLNNLQKTNDNRDELRTLMSTKLWENGLTVCSTCLLVVRVPNDPTHADCKLVNFNLATAPEVDEAVKLKQYKDRLLREAAERKEKRAEYVEFLEQEGHQRASDLEMFKSNVSKKHPKVAQENMRLRAVALKQEKEMKNNDFVEANSEMANIRDLTDEYNKQVNPRTFIITLVIILIKFHEITLMITRTDIQVDTEQVLFEAALTELSGLITLITLITLVNNPS